MLEEIEIDVPKLIEDLSKTALKLSLTYARDLANGLADKDQLKQVNEIKKHLNFAKKLHKEMNPNSNGEKENIYPQEVVDKVKKIEKTVGEIVRSMSK